MDRDRSNFPIMTKKKIPSTTGTTTARTQMTTTSLLRPLSTIEQDMDHHDLSLLSTVIKPSGATIVGGGGDAASLVTESSSSSSCEAVVSLFNCWSSIEEASPFLLDGLPKDNDDNPATVAASAAAVDAVGFAGRTVSITSPPPTSPPVVVLPSPEEVLRRLTKRLRPDDMPPIPVLKRGRKRPTCCFINYLSISSAAGGRGTIERFVLRDDYQQQATIITATTPTTTTAANNSTTTTTRTTTSPPTRAVATIVKEANSSSGSSSTSRVPKPPGLVRLQSEAVEETPRSTCMTIVTSSKCCGDKKHNPRSQYQNDGGGEDGGPFSKSPDLSASFSPTDVEFEELDLLGPLLFADVLDDDDDDNNNNEEEDGQMLFPTSVLSMSKVSFLPLLIGTGGGGDDEEGNHHRDNNNNNCRDDDRHVMVRSS